MRLGALLYRMLLRRPLLRSTLPLRRRRRTLRSSSLRRWDTWRAWRGWWAGRRGWRAGGRCRRRFLTCCRRLLTRSDSHEERRNHRKKIQPISPTHQVLRACNQQVAASSPQKERLSPRGDRQTPRESPTDCRSRPRCFGPKSMSDNSLHRRSFAPQRPWRAQPTTAAGTSRGGCWRPAPNVAAAHQSSVRPGRVALFWCQSLRQVHAK